MRVVLRIVTKLLEDNNLLPLKILNCYIISWARCYPFLVGNT